MLARVRSCPDCATPLKPATLRKASLEYCTCGGVWLPFGQLELIVGHEMKGDDLGGQTSRRCPDCTLSLTPVVLAGGIPVETCTTCRGQWLDWPDIVELKVKDLEALVQPAAAQRYAAFTSPEPEPGPSLTGFLCAKCGKRTEFAKGHGTSRGLVCGDCVAKIQPMPPISDAVVEVFLGDLGDLDDD